MTASCPAPGYGGIEEAPHPAAGTVSDGAKEAKGKGSLRVTPSSTSNGLEPLDAYPQRPRPGNPLRVLGPRV